MDLVEVKVIGLQAAQTAFDGGEDVFAGQPALVGAAAHRTPAFRRQHDAVTLPFQPFADEFFAPTNRIEIAAHRVDIGRVEEVHPVLDRGIHDGVARGLVTLPAKSHRPQANL